MSRFALAALALFIGIGPTVAQTNDQKQVTIRYLKQLERNGGYLEAPAGPRTDGIPTVRGTNAALRAIQYFGGSVDHKAETTAFLEKCYDKTTGGFVNDLAHAPGDRGKPTVVSTSVAILALAEEDGPLDRYASGVTKYLGEHAETFEDLRIAAAAFEAMKQQPPFATAWIEKVEQMRNTAGTWGKEDGVPRETGGAVALILRLGGKIDHRETVVKALKDGQRPDGAFGKPGTKGSDLETSYRIMRSLHMLQEKPADGKALRAFIARCRSEDGGYGVAPGQPANAAGTYFAATLLHWLED